MLVVAYAWNPSASDTTGPQALSTFLGFAWSPIALAGFGLAVYELVLHPRLVAEFKDIAAANVVEAMLPQQVMERLLASIYGDSDANRDVISGILGGEGTRPKGEGLTISTDTSVDLKFIAVDRTTYYVRSTLSYRFKKNVQMDRFVIFATCSPLLRDSITAGCRMPLFEEWFIPDQSFFDTSVDDMLPSVRIALDYVDQHRTQRSIQLTKPQLTEVKVKRWEEYLTFFREPMGNMPRQRIQDHLGNLRIFECDLSALTEERTQVHAVARLTLQATTRQSIDDRSCFWQPPFPCYVETITVDAEELNDDGTKYLFHVVPFAFRSNTASGGWLDAGELTDLDVRSWLLPGHGVAILWKPSAIDLGLPG